MHYHSFLSLGYLSLFSLYFLLLLLVGLILQSIQSVNSFYSLIAFLPSRYDHYLLFFQLIYFIRIYYEGLLVSTLTHWLTSVLLVFLLALDHLAKIEMWLWMSLLSFAYFIMLNFWLLLLLNSVITFNKLIYVCFHLTSLFNEFYLFRMYSSEIHLHSHLYRSYLMLYDGLKLLQCLVFILILLK